MPLSPLSNGFLTALLAVSLVLPGSAVRAADRKVEVTVRPNRVAGPVSPYVFGAGFDPKTNPIRVAKYPDKVSQDIAESGLRTARFPGGFVFARGDHRGSWANFYWQDHIGKNPQRLPYEVYDLDTFVQLCERFGIEPLMQINFVGEPEESIRGYIEYLVGDGDIDGDGVNWAARRAANGRVEPYKIRYWQPGNEVHSYPQGFQENAQGAREYAEALARLVPIIRKMSPGAKIVAPFINVERPISGMRSEFKEIDINFASPSEFTLAFLKYLDVEVDYFDWHFYSANGWGDSWPYIGTDDEWKHYYCWGTKFRECYAAIVDLMQRDCRQRPLPRLVVGEWSGDWTAAIFMNHKDSYRGSMMRTMATAVYMADILMFLLEKSIPSEHIHSAYWHTFCNDAQALFTIQTSKLHSICYKGKCTDEGYGFRMPIYWVFKLLSEQRGEELVVSQLRGENTIEAPAPGLYTDPEYNFQRVSHCATRSGDKLYLALLNKDAHETVEVALKFAQWPVKPEMVVYEVGADSYLAENTIAQPERVKLVGPRTVALKPAAPLTYSLPPNTLVVLQFERAVAGR
jgi:alpha-L-arabinofuranosidase